MNVNHGLVLSLREDEDIVISHEQDIIKLQYLKDEKDRKKIRIICDKKFNIHRIERRKAVFSIERDK